MKFSPRALTFAIASALTVAAQAADDTLRVTTINPPAGTTDCSKNSFGYALSERAAIVRGRPNHKIRIERNGVDIGLERASIESCGPSCSARITRKGNFDSGSNGHLIDRKGFVELELDTPSDASVGHATLVLHYALGGRGEYKLNIVQNSRVDRVERSTAGASAERFILTGNNLDKLRNHFFAQGPSTNTTLTRVSESDSTLVLDRTERNCSARTFELDLKLEQADACVIKNVKLPMTRDASCDSATPPPPPPPPPAPAPPPQAAPAPAPAPAVRLNLTPALLTPTPFFRSLNPTQPDGSALRRQVPQSMCAGFANDEERSVPLPPIRWGINYANLPAPAAVSADVINATTGALLQRQTAAPINQGNGSDSRLFDNWTGRPAAVRLVFAFSTAKRAALGAPPVQGGAPSPIGCYLAATEPITRFDPPRLTFRVNTATPSAAESNSNDNEITL
jgi:hypothetical protein